MMHQFSNYSRSLLFSVVLGIFLPLTAHAGAEEQGRTVRCVLRYSAVAGLDDAGNIDVHTTDNDQIEVELAGIGLKEAILNGTYPLVQLKEDAHAYYYIQPSGDGLVTWVYFKKSDVVTYSKLRAFPIDGSPSSYLMIAKCQ